jgi:acetyl esterase/lipase
MKKIVLSAMLIAIWGLSHSATKVYADDAIPAPVLLWPNGAPNATGTSNEDKPAIYVYLPNPAKSTGAGMLVVPGGGFQTRVPDHEGTLVAQWLRARGIAAFVLRYRIQPIGKMADSLADEQRAMRYLRAHADEYKIAPNRIGSIGFSAGAELLNLAAVTPGPAKPDDADPVEHFTAQANFLVLSYGSTNNPAPNASVAFPPTFMFCTAEDTGHINGMLNLYTNLLKARVPVEAHFFVNGEHGVGFAQGDPVLGQWPDLMFNWIKAGNFLTDQPRVAIKGFVTLDGAPLPRGVIVFTPIDAAGAPPTSAYIFNTGPVRGQFNVAQNKGPIPGRYLVEVHQYAMRWVSNSQEPFIVGINQKMRGGLSDQDKQDWLAFARARDLEPTIDNQRIFKTAHPDDKDPIVVEIKPDGNTAMQIDIVSK